MSRYSGERVRRRIRRVVPVANPAPGAEWSVTVPAGAVWWPLAVRSVLTTSATVGTREPALVIAETRDVITIPVPSGIEASAIGIYEWVVDVSVPGPSTTQVAPLPRIGLPAGWSVRSVTLGLDVADQWSDITLLVTEQMVAAGPVEVAEMAELIVAVAGNADSEVAR